MSAGNVARRSWRRGAVVAVAAVLAILLAAYLALPWGAVTLGRVLLRDYGVQLHHAELRRPGLRDLAVDAFSLTYRGNTFVLDIDGGGVLLHYRFGDLLRGRFDAIAIDTLHAALRAAPALRPEVAEPLALPELLPARLLALLPSADIGVRSLALELPPPSPYPRLDGAAAYRNGELSLQLAGGSAPRLELALSADTANRLGLTLREGGAVIAQIGNTIDDGTHLRGEARVMLGAVAPLLRAPGWLPAELQLDGEVLLGWSGELPAAIDAQTLRSLAANGTVKAAVSAVDTGRGLRADTQLQGQYRLAGGNVELRLDQAVVRGEVAAPAALAPWLGGPAGRPLPFTASTGSGALLRIGLEPIAAQLAGTLALQLGEPAAQLALTLTEPALRQEGEWHLRSGFVVRASLAQLTHKPYRAQGLQLDLGGDIDGGVAAGSLQLAKGWQLRARNLRWPDGVLAALTLRGDSAAALRWQGDDIALATAAIAAGPLDIRLGESNYRAASARLALRDLNLSLAEPLAASAVIGARATAVSVPLAAYQPKPVDVQADLKLAGRSVGGNWTLNAGKVLAVRGNLRHNLGNGRGELSATLPPLAFQESGNYLPALFEQWPYPLDFSAGSLGLDARARWGSGPLDATFAATLNEVGGFYELNLFRGLNATVRGSYHAGALRIEPAAVSLGSANVGIAITNVRFDLALADNTATLRELRAELLGGTLTQALINYRLDTPKNAFTLDFAGLELGQVLSLEQGVEGSGTLDGHLPVVLDADGVGVRQGEFKARAPGGYLKYTGALPAAMLANPMMKLAMEALRNFHFQMLEAVADYAGNGDMDLRVKLQGRNPDQAETRPVHFNLNVRENVPDLLKSLQLGQDISDRIEQRVQDFYERQQRESTP